jgi:hypothetical protein
MDNRSSDVTRESCTYADVADDEPDPNPVGALISAMTQRNVFPWHLKSVMTYAKVTGNCSRVTLPPWGL